MWNDRGVRRFALAVAGAAIFVTWMGAGLPDIVASHFAPGGMANGRMPRAVYLPLILLLTVGLPAISVVAGWSAVGRPGARINLPHGDYWLAPERRSRTIDDIRVAMLRFSLALLLLLCYAHWLVVRANRNVPARLDEAAFLAGLAVFLVAALAGTWRFINRFRRIS